MTVRSLTVSAPSTSSDLFKTCVGPPEAARSDRIGVCFYCAHGQRAVNERVCRPAWPLAGALTVTAMAAVWPTLPVTISIRRRMAIERDGLSFAALFPKKDRAMSKSSITTRAIATPNRVTAHPGEVLNEEFFKPLRMSVNALAIRFAGSCDAHRYHRQGRAGGNSRHCFALGALLWHQPRVLDEFTGYARSDKGANGKWRSDCARWPRVA
jgi:hypothetical protein